MCAIILVITIMLSGVSSQGRKNQEGPYEVVLYNVSSCMKEKAWFRTNLTVQGQVLSGSVDVKRELKNVQFRIRAYYLGEGPKLRIYEISKQKCRNPLIRLILVTLGLRFNHEKCTMHAALYKLNDLNLDMICHTITPSLWYGPMQVRWEVAAGATSMMCTDIYVQFVLLSGKTPKMA